MTLTRESDALLDDASIRARFLSDVTMGTPRPGSLQWLRDRLAAIEAAVRAEQAAEMAELRRAIALTTGAFEAEFERLRAALEGLVRKMAPHSGSCCIFGDDGTVIVTRESCKCGPVERAAHDVLDWYGTSWKRGSRPTGTPLAATPVAPAPAPTEPRP